MVLVKVTVSIRANIHHSMTKQLFLQSVKMERSPDIFALNTNEYLVPSYFPFYRKDSCIRYMTLLFTSGITSYTAVDTEPPFTLANSQKSFEYRDFSFEFRDFLLLGWLPQRAIGLSQFFDLFITGRRVGIILCCI